MLTDDNVDSVKRLYQEFLVKKWSWNRIDIDDSLNSIWIQTWLKQGGHTAIGQPIVLWKINNYPKGYDHELDSLYGKIKKWFLVHWDNK